MIRAASPWPTKSPWSFSVRQREQDFVSEYRDVPSSSVANHCYQLGSVSRAAKDEKIPFLVRDSTLQTPSHLIDNPDNISADDYLILSGVQCHEVFFFINIFLVSQIMKCVPRANSGLYSCEGKVYWMIPDDREETEGNLYNIITMSSDFDMCMGSALSNRTKVTPSSVHFSEEGIFTQALTTWKMSRSWDIFGGTSGIVYVIIIVYMYCKYAGTSCM